jgi:hypothetical protein
VAGEVAERPERAHARCSEEDGELGPCFEVCGEPGGPKPRRGELDAAAFDGDVGGELRGRVLGHLALTDEEPLPHFCGKLEERCREGGTYDDETGDGVGHRHHHDVANSRDGGALDLRVPPPVETGAQAEEPHRLGGRAAKRRRLPGDVALDDRELGPGVGGRQLRAGKRHRQRLPAGGRRQRPPHPTKVASYPAHRRIGAGEPLGAVALDRVGVEDVLDVEWHVLVDAPRGEVGERPDATAHRLESDVEAKDLVDHEPADLRPAVLGDPGRYVTVDVERHRVVDCARGRGE